MKECFRVTGWTNTVQMITKGSFGAEYASNTD